MIRILPPVTACAILFSCSLFAEDPGAILRADSALVVIPTLVTTFQGAPVKSLNKESFRIIEDNVEQKIAYFSEDDAPVSVALLFDMSGSMRSKMPKALEAVAAFLKTSNPHDEFLLVEFNDRARLVVPFTQDPDELYDRIVRDKPSGRTSLFDAIHLAVVQMKHARNWRKAIVILSDGGDNWSRHNVREVRNELLESDVQLYAMGVFDPDQERPTKEERDGPALLQQLAELSGGRHYPVENIGDLPSISIKISNDIRNEYLLGYYPVRADARDGKYHQVKVKLAMPAVAPDLRTYYRRGYHAPLE